MIYIISQIDGYLSKETVEKFKILVENDTKKIKSLSMIHKEYLNNEYSLIIDSIKKFQTDFSKGIIENLFIENFNQILEYIYNIILLRLPLEKSNITISYSQVKMSLNLFLLSYNFKTTFLITLNSGINNLLLQKGNQKFKIVEQLSTKVNMRVREDFGLLSLLQFGLVYEGDFDNRKTNFYVDYDLKNMLITTTSSYHRSFNYQQYLTMSIPYVKLVKYRIKMGFIKITIYYPIIQLKTVNLLFYKDKHESSLTSENIF